MDDAKFQKKIELVSQMLSKAASTTPEEAEALTAAAEKIMLRLGISQAMLRNADLAGGSAAMTHHDIPFTGVYAPAMGNTLGAVAKHFGGVAVVLIVSGKNKNKVTLQIAGHTFQVELVSLLITSLAQQAIAAMQAWWKDSRDLYLDYSGSQQFRARRQFIFSFGAGVRERIESERQDAEQDEVGSALVLHDEAEAAASFLRDLHSQARFARHRSMKGGDLNAAAHGLEAGRKANIGTTQIGA